MKRIAAKQRPLTKRMQEVVQFKLDHPNDTHDAIGKALGISRSRVTYILNHKRIRDAFVPASKEYLKNALPNAAHTMVDLVKQRENLEVARKAAVEILNTNRVLEPETKININVYAELSTDKVAASVRDGLKIPVKDVLDAEIVGNDEETAG